MDVERLPVAVIGAGPIGLAASAHLNERGLTAVVLEKGRVPAASIASWEHVRLFSPWRLNINDAGRRALERHGGWDPPDPDAYPTGAELRSRYLLPLAEVLDNTGVRLSLRSRVITVNRLSGERADDRESAPFEITFDRGRGRDRLLASAVIDASGSWDSPNPLGVDGTPVPGEHEFSEHITYGIPDVLGADRGRYAARQTLVVGGGDSAMHLVNDLSRLAREVPETRFVWAIRGPALAQPGAARAQSNGLPQRAMLRERARTLVESDAVEFVSDFAIESLQRRDAKVAVITRGHGEITVDEIIANTGVRPDLTPLRELQLALDPVLEAPVALAPLIDPRFHSCATVPWHGARELSQPEAGFFLAGMKSYGRASTFLLTNGYEQVSSIAAVLAGEKATSERARDVLTPACACGSDPRPETISIGGSSCGPGCC